jgi:hypothetical protein
VAIHGFHAESVAHLNSVCMRILCLTSQTVNPNKLASDLGDASSTATSEAESSKGSGVVTVYPAEAVVVLLDVSNSMMLEAYPEDEVVVDVAPGHTRIRCSSLLSSFVAEVPSTSSVLEFRQWLLANQGIPMDTELFYAGQALEDDKAIADYSIGRFPVFCNTDVGFPPSPPFSRLDVVKALFHALANRSMAYTYRHVIGLTLFASDVTRTCDLTELFVNFLAKVDAAKPNGQTRLYDALAAAREELSRFCDDYPRCLKRILCLTDGQDTCSDAREESVAASLQVDGVVVDAVVIGDGNNVLKAISHVTGGCCFRPGSLQEAQELFEMEAVLSLRERVRKTPVPTVNSISDLLHFMDVVTHPFDTKVQQSLRVCLRVLSVSIPVCYVCLVPSAGEAVSR